jgi:hypothetical protein
MPKSSVGDPDPQDPHVFPDPLVRGTDPDPSLFSECVERTEIMLGEKIGTQILTTNQIFWTEKDDLPVGQVIKKYEGMDPGIRIRTNISRIPNTAKKASIIPIFFT